MRTETSSLPAIAGGDLAFDKLLPIVNPEGLPGEAYLRTVQKILESRALTNHAHVREFEEAAAAYLGVPNCVAVSSCTSGLILTLRALELRGEVILPSFTFYATAHSVLWNGLTPVFADCEADTFCLSPESTREKISPRTAAILGVHIFGHSADVNALQEIAEERGIPLIFDAAHAFGSRFTGRHVGGFGTAEVFSFSPTKLLVAGEGGLVCTRDAALARKLHAARNYGDGGGYNPELLGFNARMSELHAALALHGLADLDARVARRNDIAHRYRSRLQGLPGISFQQIRAGCRTTCKDFALLVDEGAFGASRDWLVEALLRENIEVRRYFSPPLHHQTLYRRFWDGRPLPCTESTSARILNLPIYSSLSNADVDRVCDAIIRAHEFVVKNADTTETVA